MEEKIMESVQVWDRIWERVVAINLSGFFVTVDIVRQGDQLPSGALEDYIQKKAGIIRKGSLARKFVFTEGEWRIYLTFFPTDEVVDERYAMKNRVMKQKKTVK